MEKTIIILNLFKQRNMKIYNIFEPDFDEVLIKQYMLSYNRMDEENINTFKELYSFIISEKENGKKENNISNEKKMKKKKMKFRNNISLTIMNIILHSLQIVKN